MRVITGTLKGRTIPVPDTGELRPTSDRTKEAIFSVIDARRYIEGSHILDLFAGSGNLGIEAISRGADHVLFVDRNPVHIRHIESIVKKFGIENQVATLAQPVEEYLKQISDPYDFILSDPPYEYPLMAEMIELILEKKCLKPNGWFILEHDKRHDFKEHPHCFFSKAYGRTIVSMFQLQPVDSD